MKKQMSLFIWAMAVFGMSDVLAATNSGMSGASRADLDAGPSVRTTAKVNYEKYETKTSTKTYTVKDNKNIYYKTPAARTASYNTSASSSQTSSSARAATARATAKRKYYLAHPFYQPLKGKIGSITDLAYNTSSYNMKLTPSDGFDISDNKAKWDMTQITIKEDLSYGITDTFAIVGMARYASSDYKFDWSASPDDSMSESKFDLWGLGGQWRFVDNAEWIATLSGYFQQQIDISNNFLVDLKAGYKVGSSTIYGLARGWMVNFKGNSYGNGIENNGTAIFIAYQTGDKNATYMEGGVGLFSVLNEDWTLNIEAVLGNYDWHNQATLKGAIGWQPYDNFALNLYVKTAIYDSADDKNLGFWWIDPSMTGWEQRGNAQLSNYSETSVGLQAIFQF